MTVAVPRRCWNGRDEAGRKVGSRVYFLRSVTGGEKNRLKVVVVL